MEILDAQVHLNHIHPEWKTANIDDIFAAALAAMNAVGVDGLVVSEYWGFDERWREEVAGGVFRCRRFRGSWRQPWRLAPFGLAPLC
jgi:hypothetical protein